MPVADTEVLFALSPADPKHRPVLRILKSYDDVVVPDVALLEFELVLRARGRNTGEIKLAILALHEALMRHNVREVQTLSSSSLAYRCELEEKHELSYFDGLIAVAALLGDRIIISNDDAFDRVPRLKRIPLKG